MSRVNNVLREISQFNTYEKSQVLEFLKTVLLSSDVSNSVNGEIAENSFNKFTKSPIASSKKSIDKWLLYAQCLINNRTIRQCA